VGKDVKDLQGGGEEKASGATEQEKTLYCQLINKGEGIFG